MPFMGPTKSYQDSCLQAKRLSLPSTFSPQSLSVYNEFCALSKRHRMSYTSGEYLTHGIESGLRKAVFSCDSISPSLAELAVIPREACSPQAVVLFLSAHRRVGLPPIRTHTETKVQVLVVYLAGGNR